MMCAPGWRKGLTARYLVPENTGLPPKSQRGRTARCVSDPW
jgi:hypothetical protein